jgi:citrate lyase alpha subunit
MADAIDAFFVTLGLDTSQFTTGQKEAEKAWTKTEDQTVAATKQIEENTRKLSQSFDTLKQQAIEFFTVLMGMTSSYSNAFHVGDVHVNAPNATDSKGLADSIADALQLSLHASLADYGQA